MKTLFSIFLSTFVFLSVTPALADGDFCSAFKGNSLKTEQFGLCHSYCDVKNCYDNSLRKGSQASCDAILAAYSKKFHEPPPCMNQPAVSVEKKTNGVLSSDYSLQLLVGDPVTWTYKVTNTGNTNVTVNSVVDLGTSGNSTSTGNSTPTVTCVPAYPVVLAPGQVLNCQASGAVIQGSYSNEVTVSATGGGSNLTATAQGAYTGLTQGIAIVKDNGGVTTVYPNTAFTWNITVTNTGQFNLTNISYTDSESTANLSACPTTLAAGASASCTTTVNSPATIGDWTNTVNVVAHFMDGSGQDHQVTGTSNATTTVVTPTVACPCFDRWNNGIGASPISQYTFTSASQCLAVWDTNLQTVTVAAFGDYNTPWTASQYQINSGGSGFYGQCGDTNGTTSSDYDSPPYHQFTKPEFDACVQLLKDRGCPF